MCSHDSHTLCHIPHATSTFERWWMRSMMSLWPKRWALTRKDRSVPLGRTKCCHHSQLGLPPHPLSTYCGGLLFKKEPQLCKINMFTARNSWTSFPPLKSISSRTRCSLPFPQVMIHSGSRGLGHQAQLGVDTTSDFRNVFSGGKPSRFWVRNCDPIAIVYGDVFLRNWDVPKVWMQS